MNTGDEFSMMSDLQEPGSQIAKYFRLGEVPQPSHRSAFKPNIAITRLASQNGLPEQTASIPREKAFVVSLHLHATAGARSGWMSAIHESRHGQPEVWGFMTWRLTLVPAIEVRLTGSTTTFPARRSMCLRMTPRWVALRLFDVSTEPSPPYF
jgi:hypothetical protein